ncbi:MAG: GntR family transcriptional regulator [Verrucomicrobia bacterium]|nr:GntR family transcriptional regulator [Verrucomicrobiota bacterium]
MLMIGRRNTLRVVRDAAPGFYLAGDDQREILLPGRYIPPGAKPGDNLDVFVYLDSEDRLVATTETPLASVGEFAWLQVVSVVPRIGAFLHWGLAKDLLLPFHEQTKPVRRKEWVAAFIFLDPVSHRIVATTRLGRHLSQTPPTYAEGQTVNLLVTAKTNLGYNAIVEQAHRGLLYHSDLAGPLIPGQKMQGFVRKVRSDGKIDLSLDAAGYRRVAPLTEQILLALQASGGRLAFDDATSPQAVRDKFGVSKNAFKQALGALYKKRLIRFLNPGIELTDKQA